MEFFDIKKENGYRISCVKALPAQQDPARDAVQSGQPVLAEQARGIVIVVHGFASSRNCATYQMLSKELPAAGYGMIGIELPGHGVAASSEETLRIGAALDSIAAAEQYALKHFPGLPLYYFGSSFGAFLLGVYISTRPHRGRKVFFRSAAVNMPELFVKKDPTPVEQKMLDELKEKGYFMSHTDLGSPIKVTAGFYDDLAQTDLFRIFDKDRFGEHLVAMSHGAEDAVIDPAAARRFAEQFHIPITFFAGEGHSLGNDPDTPIKVAELAISLYETE